MFSSVKSTLHFLLFFLTTTGLETHFGNWASLMVLAFNYFWTSSSTDFAFSSAILLGFCFTCLKFLSTWSLWHNTLASIPGIFEGCHVKTSMLPFKNMSISFLSSSSRELPIKNLSLALLPSSAGTCTNSLKKGSSGRPRAPPLIDQPSCNC